MSQASASDWRETSVGGTTESVASGTGVTRVQMEGADDVWGRQHCSPGLSQSRGEERHEQGDPADETRPMCLTTCPHVVILHTIFRSAF